MWPLYTRVLRRRPVRDGERWLLLKEAAVYGDDPRHAFSVTPPETVRRPSPADRDGASPVWESAIKPALAIVGPTAVARKMELAARTARAWAAGARRPEQTREVAHVIVSVAREAGLGSPSDQHLRAEEICAELPRRAAVVQCFISFMTATLAVRHGSIRGLARAISGDDEIGLEPTVRRWLGLAHGEPRPIAELNSIVARLAKFSRSETRKLRRRIVTEPGPGGDRQAIGGYLSLAYGAEKPVILTNEEARALPAALAIAALLILLWPTISRIFQDAPINF